MPEEKVTPQTQHVDLETEPLKTSTQTIGDWYALEMVRRNFWHYEQYRAQNHDRRWNNQDSLYTGWLPQKFWEGSNVPRSSLSMQLVFDQIEASLPEISNALFMEPEWFDVEPEPGARLEEAQAIKDNLLYNLEHNKETGSTSARVEIELAVKDVLMHGNGGVVVEWNGALNRPTIRWIDLRNVYIDPGLATPDVDEGRGVIWRRLMTVDELLALKDAPGMKIPEAAILNYMARNLQSAYGDDTKRIQEAMRGVNFNPATMDSWTPVPADRKVEVLIQYTKSRIIWVLNREYVAFNEPNPYGFIPFCFAPCYIFLGRFYAMSMADVNEGNQRTIEGLINARLDELSLSLFPPRVAKAGALMTPSQQRWRPGAVQNVAGPPGSDVNKDVAHIFPQGATANIWQEVSYLEGAAEKRTGRTAMSMGVPKPGNVNRTATGVRSQLQGAAGRLVYIVSNIENYLIVPMLYKMYRMTQVHTQPDQMLPARSNKYDVYYPINAQAFRRPVQFRMQAASRMISTGQLQQIMPFLLQYFMNGQFVANLNRTGQTVDFNVVAKAIQDASGAAKKYVFIRPLNQQEQQALNQPPPEAQAEQQRMQMEQQSKQQELQLKAQLDAQKAQMDMQIKAQEAQVKLQTEQALAEVEAQLGKMKLEMEQMKMTMEMRKAQMQIGADAQRHQLEMQMKQQQHAQQIQQAREANEEARRQGFVDSMIGQERGRVEHEQKLSQSRAEGEQKISLLKRQAQIRSKTKGKSK